MKRPVLIWRRTVILGFAAVSLSNCAADELGDAVRSVIDQVTPSVVRIQIVGAPDRAGKIASRVTTGVVVSADGEIVSSSFGFGSDIAAVFVKTADGERHAAEVVATDHVRKLVLLRTKTSKLLIPNWAVEEPAVGAWAIAAGRFYDTSTPSAALGVISAVNRVHGLAIQTDAKVSPINYGGPLLGMDGSVFGILVPLAPGNEATGVTAGVEWYDSGIGFAIPARDVLDTLEQLRSGKDRNHGVLGLSLASQNPLSPVAEVKNVHPGSPADSVGIQVGDRILAVNGRSIGRLGMLQSCLKSSWAGDTVSLIVRRGTAEQQIEVTLSDELTVSENGWLGIVPVAAARTNDSEGQGVLVGVLHDSPADAAGLSNPCIVTRVNDVAILSVKQLRDALKEIAVGTSRQLTFAPPDRPAQHQTVSVSASIRKTGEVALLAAEIASIRALAITVPPASEWTQTVTDLKEQQYAWVLGPKQQLPGVELGVVILLHDGEPVTDTLIQDWREVCQQHQLVLAVVYHEYAIPLDSIETVRMVIAAIAKLGSIDPDRMALVTPESHAAFVTRMLLDPRIRPIRQAVFIGCRPAIGGASLASLPQKTPSLLLFPSDTDKQDRALLTTSVTTLREAGAMVLVSRSSADVRGVEQAGEIARWMLLQKIR